MRWFDTSRLGLLSVFVMALPRLVGCGSASEPVAAPDPYIPPAQGAPECELAADCPAGTYCDLGECAQECNLIDRCQEGVCIERGRCAASGDAPSDPPLRTRPSAVVRAEASQVYVGPDEKVAVLRFSATPETESIRYRVAPKMAWLEAPNPRGEFTGALTLMLDVDRARLELGEHLGTVVLHTTEGTVTVGVSLEQSLTGVYRGELHYEAPQALGRVPVEIEARDQGLHVDLRVLSERSPTFPLVQNVEATATATPSPNGGVYEGAFVQHIAQADLGGDQALLARDLGRELRFVLSPGTDGGLVGTFRERWFALFPEPVEVSGTIRLTRVEGEPEAFSVALPPPLPDPPSVAPPPISAACYAATRAVGTERGAACTASSSASDLRECGRRLVDRARAFESFKLVGPSPSGSKYDELAALCETDLDANRSGPQAAITACTHPGNLACAEALLGQAVHRGDAEAYAAFQGVVAAHAGSHLLVANQSMVEGFEAPYRLTGRIEEAVLRSLDKARLQTNAGLRRITNPHLLRSLRETPRTAAQQGEYEGIRRAAQLLSQHRLAADEIASVRIRTDPNRRPEVRASIQRDALGLLVGLVALSEVQRAQQAPASVELGLLADMLTDLGQRSVQADPNLNPLGLPSDYVPFVYSPDRAGTLPTNFHQLLANATPNLSAAAAAESAARTASREYEQSVDALRAELNRVSDATRTQLRLLCGARPDNPTRPALNTCGERVEGQLAEARAVHQEATVGIETARARIESLEARLRIQSRRLQTVYGIRQDTLNFITRTNRTINMFQVQRDILGVAVTCLEIASNSSLWNGGAAAGMAAVAAVYEAMGRALALAQQRLAQAQELRIRADEARVEYINGMATLQEMLTQLGEVTLELAQAVQRAAIASIRVATLMREVESLQADYALLEERILSGADNDPGFRVVRDQLGLAAIAARERALRTVYFVARSYEHETNTELSAIQTDLIPAMTSAQISQFVNCLEASYSAFQNAFGSPQVFTDEISLREDIFGIREPLPDPVTGEVLSEAEQFRRLLLQPSNLGPDGTVGLSFATSLSRGNGLFSTQVCNDQIQSLQVRVIGDGLGDGEARIYLEHGGGSIQRACEAFRNGAGDKVREHAVQPRRIEVQAGVNAWSSAPPDTQLTGRSVATSEWKLSIPPGAVAPANLDVDPLRIDDIVLRVQHRAISISDGPITYRAACGG